ncbi:alpha-amylase family glycosyl hydrolase [Mycoplasmoides fastidiosum]|nr:alpha-amylase family glycosyl hydrolase [Mycoplasmoides fastidiosum]
MTATSWKNKIIYQIFPRSFKDANNDGDGDLQGIIQKLDYIQSLHVDIIWLCPIYETEFADAGYDVIDYFSVWSKFGTLEDFKQLVKAAKKRNIDIMMDVVLNHTSSKNKWFIEALKSPDQPEHQFYIWTDLPGKEESIFGGSSWTYVPHLKKYYYHLFAEEQVDLNWMNQTTIDNFAKVIDFWYGLGVKCFRLDAIQHVAKDFGATFSHSFATHMVEILKKFNQAAFANKPDVYTFGEASGMNPQKILEYGTGINQVCQNFYNFSWWWVGWNQQTGRNGVDFNWDVSNLANPDARLYQSDVRIKTEMLTNFATNHDTARAISRWGNEGIYWEQSAKALCLLLMSLKGIPSIYFGEEIGMLNNHFQNRSEFRDVDALNAFKLLVDEKQIYSEEEMLIGHNVNSRDHSRYPMQWDGGKNYGFSENDQTWIKLGKNFENKISVANQENDPQSILNFYRDVIKLRKSSEFNQLFLDGNSHFEFSENLLWVKRTYQNQTTLTIINLSLQEVVLTKPISYQQILFSSYRDQKSITNKLRPYEAVLLLI